MSYPKHPDGRVKMPNELTPEERREVDRIVAERIEHELATADYGNEPDTDDDNE